MGQKHSCFMCKSIATNRYQTTLNVSISDDVPPHLSDFAGIRKYADEMTSYGYTFSCDSHSPIILNKMGELQLRYLVIHEDSGFIYL